jgi:hypothetical protein
MNTDPFTYQSTESTPAGIILPNETYTIVTEAEDALGEQDIDDRYDTIQHLAGSKVHGYVSSLTDDDREVAIFKGRLTSPKTIVRNIPVGYAYPGGVWRKVTER